MLLEHAITYRDRLSIADLEYIVKKAYKIGKAGREIVRVHEESDNEGTHIYFNVIGNHESRRNETEI